MAETAELDAPIVYQPLREVANELSVAPDELAEWLFSEGYLVVEEDRVRPGSGHRGDSIQLSSSGLRDMSKSSLQRVRVGSGLAAYLRRNAVAVKRAARDPQRQIPAYEESEVTAKATLMQARALAERKGRSVPLDAVVCHEAASAFLATGGENPAEEAVEGYGSAPAIEGFAAFSVAAAAKAERNAGGVARPARSSNSVLPADMMERVRKRQMAEAKKAAKKSKSRKAAKSKARSRAAAPKTRASRSPRKPVAKRSGTTAKPAGPASAEGPFSGAGQKVPVTIRPVASSAPGDRYCILHAPECVADAFRDKVAATESDGETLVVRAVEPTRERPTPRFRGKRPHVLFSHQSEAKRFLLSRGEFRECEAEIGDDGSSLRFSLADVDRAVRDRLSGSAEVACEVRRRQAGDGLAVKLALPGNVSEAVSSRNVTFRGDGASYLRIAPAPKGRVKPHVVGDEVEIDVPSAETAHIPNAERLARLAESGETRAHLFRDGEIWVAVEKGGAQTETPEPKRRADAGRHTEASMGFFASGYVAYRVPRCAVERVFGPTDGTPVEAKIEGSLGEGLTVRPPATGESPDAQIETGMQSKNVRLRLPRSAFEQVADPESRDVLERVRRSGRTEKRDDLSARYGADRIDLPGSADFLAGTPLLAAAEADNADRSDALDALLGKVRFAEGEAAFKRVASGSARRAECAIDLTAEAANAILERTRAAAPGMPSVADVAACAREGWLPENHIHLVARRNGGPLEIHSGVRAVSAAALAGSPQASAPVAVTVEKVAREREVHPAASGERPRQTATHRLHERVRAWVAGAE